VERRLGSGATASSGGVRVGVPRAPHVALRTALDDYLHGKARSGAWNRLIVKYFKEDSLEVLGRAN
jgi:hypothetical protein